MKAERTYSGSHKGLALGLEVPPLGSSWVSSSSQEGRLLLWLLPLPKALGVKPSPVSLSESDWELLALMSLIIILHFFCSGLFVLIFFPFYYHLSVIYFVSLRIVLGCKVLCFPVVGTIAKHWPLFLHITGVLILHLSQCIVPFFWGQAP
jgi:hypothetical protein